MLGILKSFSLDFARAGVTESVFAKEGDKYSRLLEITPMISGSPWELPEGVIARLAAVKPDGKKLICDCEINEDGKITLALGDQLLAASGTVICEIVLFGEEGEICSSEPFSIKVAGCAVAPGCELSENETSAAANVIAKLDGIYRELRSAIDSGEVFGIRVDGELSDSSENAVQNKAIKAAIDAVYAYIDAKIDGAMEASY